MASMKLPCPLNSFIYNLTRCACNPGHVLSRDGSACVLFQVPTEEAEFTVGSGVGGGSSLTLPETIFAFDSIRKITQSQAVFLEATLVMLLSWLVFCFALRFVKLGDGRHIWFHMRWWISRMDVCFSTRHWLDDQQYVKKRKTELGGTFSMASWILFVGLFAALLYQIILKRSIEVHNIRATNAPDLTTFVNDMEFNITTISNMSCSHLRGLDTVVSGTPGFIDQRVASLSVFANHSCHNTSKGPTVTLKCKGCPLIQDPVFISWQFVDLPNDPATAVGFQFNLTAKNHADSKHLSFVSGTLKNKSNLDDSPISFRGARANVLKFNLFPRIYHNLHDLKLIQPLFQEFLPGSAFSGIRELQASLQSSIDGLINTTLLINPLSAYIVEIEKRSILGPVSFLADLGGIYCFSICIFLYFLVQCEYRIKKLRSEDRILCGVRNRRKAQDRWDKLRKYVRYTWASNALDDDCNNIEERSCCHGVVTESCHPHVLPRKQSHPLKIDSLRFNKKAGFPSKKNVTRECVNTEAVKSLSGTVLDSDKEGRLSHERDEHVLKTDGKNERHVGSSEVDVSQPQRVQPIDDYTLPPLPSLEYKAGSEMDLSDIKKNLQNLYEYNVMLREKFLSNQSALQAVRGNASSTATGNQPDVASWSCFSE